MSLSDRLRAAEQQRRSSTTSADDSTLDLTSSDAAVIDLTARRQQSSGNRAGHGSESTLEPYRLRAGPRRTRVGRGRRRHQLQPGPRR